MPKQSGKSWRGCPSIPSKLACRPKIWGAPETDRSIPHGGYFALLSFNGLLEWFLLGIGNYPIKASLSLDLWVTITDNREWEVFDLPVGHTGYTGYVQQDITAESGGV